MPSRSLMLCAVAGALLVLHPPVLRAQSAAADSAHTLPFSAEEDHDGARFVWFVYGRNGFGYEYAPVDSFPREGDFTEVEPTMVQAGDVARWPQWMGIADGKGNVVGAGGRRTVAALTQQYGAPPRYFRRLAHVHKP